MTRLRLAVAFAVALAVSCRLARGLQEDQGLESSSGEATSGEFSRTRKNAVRRRAIAAQPLGWTPESSPAPEGPSSVAPGSQSSPQTVSGPLPPPLPPKKRRPVTHSEGNQHAGFAAAESLSVMTGASPGDPGQDVTYAELDFAGVGPSRPPSRQERRTVYATLQFPPPASSPAADLEGSPASPRSPLFGSVRPRRRKRD
ncbi:hypothetical protein CSUI_008380 [Cystoisospora suis]|uniref:Transmembrane protein n=1 Tax=Cystoisospora suis TaxID=483139 RepID=A0A2C6KMU4_9APIC|nr:hypothetical protein CSUI_008380 [Cystoisospora suis]